MTLETLDVERALGGLKDFQRRTVDHVFQRMWLDDDPATRFLVADEVGLGKTLVARGIIARTLEHLRESVDRIDIVYVCSNAAIAQQNIDRLNVLGDEFLARASRLTLLPEQLHEMDQNQVNIISFTPQTTFNLRSSGGIWRERILLHRLLCQRYKDLRTPLVRVLRGDVKLRPFRDRLRAKHPPLNRAISVRFHEALEQSPHLVRRLYSVCEEFERPRKRIPQDKRERQFALIGELRELLARVCVDALEPDLVILDEFQRFQSLLDGEDDAAQLARLMMTQVAPEGHSVRVLLLSATPYKPLTLSDDEEDHYRDFLRTLDFLYGGDERVQELETHLRQYRRGLYAGAAADLQESRGEIERLLRSVMVRTERVKRTDERDAMLRTRHCEAKLKGRDLDEIELLSEMSRILGATDPLEYWKSAPHVLHFMKDYQLKRKLDEVVNESPERLLDALRSRRKTLLKRSDVREYSRLPMANGRLRSLVEDQVDGGQWQLLWLPPSLPYTQPEGAYASAPDFTKALVFSAWHVVPDAISAVCSYEVERRMVEHSGTPPEYQELYVARRGLLRFTESHDRLTGMPTLALMYPSPTLADLGDPLSLALEFGDGSPLSQERAKEVVSERIRAALRETGVWPRAGDGPVDQRWYWAALAILDWRRIGEQQRWLRNADGWRGALTGREGKDKGVRQHIEMFWRAVNKELDESLGPAPDDLVEVLTLFALGGPAICAMRALRRISSDAETRPLLQSAATIASGFRTLFNLPESRSVLRGEDDEAYWRLVLQYCADGNLQAVLDEYAHQLRESLGLADHPTEEVLAKIAEEMADALSLRTAFVAADEIWPTQSGSIRIRPFRIRTRFALRFGDLRDDSDQVLARVGSVRAAFNSPFRPFVLASTSIGQEGLDFHPYCHAVYHWNLPSNPVDLEQREGRVHRYKGHAVRKNVARRWGLGALTNHSLNGGDPWAELFRLAAENRPAAANDLVPFWIYEVEGGAHVERRVPMFPFSRERGKLARLQRQLAVYRLAFGQPRQEDLLKFLEDSQATYDEMRISLEPPESMSEEG